MAKNLGINRCWYHKGNFPHYDIPIGRLEEIRKLCTIVSSKDIVNIIKEHNTLRGGAVG